MPKRKVYLTGMLPQPVVDHLKENCEAEMNLEDRLLTKEECLYEC